MSSLPNFILAAAGCLSIWVLWKAWRRPSPFDKIPGPPIASFFQGNFAQLFCDNMRDVQMNWLKEYGSVIKLKFVSETVLLVSDPKALHSVVVKDQHLYEPLPAILLFSRIFFGPGLTSTVGEQHRKERKILNPVFSIAHLRDMVPIFYDVAYKLKDTIASKVKEGPQEVELLDWMSRTALELIGQSGFGYSFDDLKEDSVPHPFAASVKRFDAMMRKLALAQRYLLPIFSRIGTRRFQRFVLRLLPWKSVQDTLELVDTLHETSVEIVKSRKVALAQGQEAMERQVGKGKDIISILLRANEQTEARDRLSDEEVVGQISTFTFAAMDTTSTALARTLWILAQRQDAQDKLRREIREAQQGQENLNYDDLVNLPYLDAVCRETMRVYPPIGALVRRTREDVVLSLGTPTRGTDGVEIDKIPIPKNTDVFVNVTACNNDPAIWGEDCHEWKPERWMQGLPESVAAARIPGVFANLMTFMGGGRACIGFKFSQLEMKVVLLLLIGSFKFSLPPDKEILWKTQRIAKPSVVGVSAYRLPLMVERAV